jgi:preprotein translocase subunit SecD
VLVVVAAGALFAVVVAGTGWFVLSRLTADETRVTLVGTLPLGGPPTAEALAQASDVLAGRFETAGLDDPEVRVDGDRLVATFSEDPDRALLDGLLVPGELRFRKVLESVPALGSCAQLGDRPSGTVPADQPDTACDAEFLYELAPATVTDVDVATARAEISELDGRWVISVEFTEQGQGRWTELTREASTNAGGECRSTGDQGNCLVAIVLDNVVIWAPQVIDVISGPVDITGDFSADEARLLAAQLAHGSQPLALEIESYEP